ncbi:sensor histidine kinase [Spirulina major]|uniref:sensor histidine kinase n=1 Tax=Spirulina major TaxID=270636 RepID=UPI0009337C83|nr:histidine kinase dimerization/phospho-acceptor domain-containing protein [Spirulina major]
MDDLQTIESLSADLATMTLAYEQAIHLGQLKSGFLARTSHELRAPLSSMMGLHQLILSDLCESPEEERDFIRQAHEAAQRLLKLLDEIIYVSKLDYGANQIEVHPLAIQTVFAGIERLTHLLATNRGYGLTIPDIDDELYIMADEKKFVQAIANIISAAIALMKEGELSLSLEPHAETVDLVLQIQSPHTIWEANPADAPLPPLATADTGYRLPTPLPSAAMTFHLSRTLIQHMAGSLTLEATPAAGDALTQIRFQIPTTEPEPELLD